MYSISYQLSSIGQMVETLIPEYRGKINIFVVDTKLAAYMQGYIAVQAKKMALQGRSVEDILTYSRYLVENCHAYFIVDDLTYLVKNGRLSGAAGFLGGLLKIKPVLELTKEGKIVSILKVKTHRKAVETALSMLISEVEKAKKVYIAVLHSVLDEEAKEIATYLKKNCPNAETIEIHMITPAVGAHIGCGVLGFGYFILEK
jgi:DegV family protein with EDD domain